MFFSENSFSSFFWTVFVAFWGEIVAPKDHSWKVFDEQNRKGYDVGFSYFPELNF